MDSDELKRLIKETVKEGVQEELGRFKVDAEKHYKHHLFLDEFMSWTSDIKSSFWKGLITTSVRGLVIVFILGLVVWFGAKAAALHIWEVVK